MAMALRLMLWPRSDEATMFCTSIFGSVLMWMPAFSSCLMTFSMADLDLVQALRAGADDLAAAEQQCRGLRLLQAVDQSGEPLRLVLSALQGVAIDGRSSSVPKEVEATTFSILYFEIGKPR